MFISCQLHCQSQLRVHQDSKEIYWSEPLLSPFLWEEERLGLLNKMEKYVVPTFLFANRGNESALGYVLWGLYPFLSVKFEASERVTFLLL